MASAPKVKKGGYDAAAKRAERARETYRIGVKDSDLSFEFQPYNVPVSVRAAVRDQTGKSIEVLLFAPEGFDVATYCDMWWIARMAGGEDVSRAQVQAEWDERVPGVTREDITDEKVPHPEA